MLATSSFSSTQELPRYRLVFPFDAPVDLAEHAALDREIVRQVAIELGVAGVTDTSKLGANHYSILAAQQFVPKIACPSCWRASPSMGPT